MALNIKDPETDRLVRELAAATGASITQVIRTAVEAELRRVRHRPGDPVSLRDIIARGRARRTIDHRSEDEILGYGADGLPT